MVDGSASFWEIAGTVGDVVAGLGTAGALFVAVRVYRMQVRDARSAQAARVLLDVRPYVGETVIDAEVTKWDVAVTNQSDLPIYNGEVCLEYGQKSPVSRPRTWSIGTIKPEEVTSQGLAADDDGFYPHYRATLTFNDSAGREWCREVAGNVMTGRTVVNIRGSGRRWSKDD